MRSVTTRRFFVVASTLPLALPPIAWLLAAAIDAAVDPRWVESLGLRGILGLIATSGLLSTVPYGLYYAFVWLVWKPHALRSLLAAVAGAIIVPPLLLIVGLSALLPWRPAGAVHAAPFWFVLAVLVALGYACVMLVALAVGRRSRWVDDSE